MNIENIEISELLNTEGRFVDWAEKVANKLPLSKEDEALSEVVNNYSKDVWKLGKASAREAISELIVKVIEPEVFSPITEDILSQIFTPNSYGEFDKIRIMNTPKNTLIAYENAARTGNVRKSYIDFTVGQVRETNIQIEFEIDYDALRREGAFTIATYIMYALEEIRNKKFATIFNFVDSLINGGDNEIESAGGVLTLQALREFTDTLDDNCFEGTPTAIGLSSIVRNAMRTSGVQEMMSDSVKDQIFRNGANSVKQFSGTDWVSVKAGKKTGKGELLLPKDKIYGFCGKIGEMYTKGEMTIDSERDMNSRKIHFMLSGIEFGICIKDLTKVYKLVVTK